MAIVRACWTTRYISALDLHLGFGRSAPRLPLVEAMCLACRCSASQGLRVELDHCVVERQDHVGFQVHVALCFEMYRSTPGGESDHVTGECHRPLGDLHRDDAL